MIAGIKPVSTHVLYLSVACFSLCAGCDRNTTEPNQPSSAQPLQAAANPAPAPASESPQASPLPAPNPTAIACNAKETRLAPGKNETDRTFTRVVGGREAEKDKWPWAVALAFKTSTGPKPFCGGALIKPNWVVTAAHCQVLTSDIAIIGRHDLTTQEGEEIAIKRVLNHADYNPDTNNHDVAVLELEKPVTAKTLKLARSNPSSVASVGTVIGWGLLKEGGKQSETLQEVDVPLVTNQECQPGYPNVALTESMLCAGLKQGGKDSCQGDSGGPLMIKQADGSWAQAGIVSFGIGCAQPGHFGVYARVQKLAPWIDACTQ